MTMVLALQAQKVEEAEVFMCCCSTFSGGACCNTVTIG